MTNATPAPIGADALREALKWAAAALQAIASDEDTVRDKATGETLSVGQILDAADAALASAAQPVAAPHAQMTEEIDNILSDPDTRLSPGAERALCWLRTWTDAPLVLAAAPKAAPQPAAQHPDDAAVDALAMLMKAKLAKQRAKGYGGWDSAECKKEWLSALLREHVIKGDPVDVANFCAFLSARGEVIAPSPAEALREAEMLFAKAPQSAVQQGDAEQREVDARHAAIYRWMLSHIADVLNIFDNWCTDEEAGTDELHDVLVARAAKEGGA